MSMYRQLWLAFMVSMLLALGGGVVASLLSARSYLESQLALKNNDNAVALALSLSVHPDQSDPVTMGLIVAALFDSGHYSSIHIRDPFGKTLIERSDPEPIADAPAWFVRRFPIHAQAGQALITRGWRQAGSVTLESHSRFAYGALWQTAYAMAGVLALAGVAGGLLGTLVLRRLRKPLQTMIDQASALTQRRFVTVEAPRVPELRQLAHAMNTLVDRLKGMFEDEAQRVEQLRQVAHTDPLTGLANRSHMMALLRQTLEADDASGGTLILLRVLGLAGINQRLGRPATDAYLHAMAQVLTRTFAGVQGVVTARLQGADFAVIVPSAWDGAHFARMLLAPLQQVAVPYVDGADAVAIGFGRFAPKDDLSRLLARVDGALATAERQPADPVHEVPSSVGAGLARSSLEWAALINGALTHDRVTLAQFPVHSVNGAPLHWECPLRLKLEETADWVPAARFWPVAERLTMTPALDLRAVALGLSLLASHPDDAGVAINLSASSLLHPTFQRDLLSLLDHAAPHSRRLWLEWAEEGALKHLPALQALCVQLKQRGCKVGLEHFGHRVSHIGRLHGMGLDYVKLDASFVQGIQGHGGNQTFVKGLCAMARAMGWQVVAEGVATVDERDTLQTLGVDGLTGPLLRG